MSSKPRNIAIIHTRPESLFEPLAALGWTPLPCPVLDIVDLAFDVPKGYEVALISSIHAIPAAMQCGLPAIVVGEQTGQVALEAGLTLMMPAVETMRDIVLHKTKFLPARVIHLSGEDVSEDTPMVLDNINADRIAVYKATPRSSLPDDILQALEQNDSTAVMIFSPRSAEVFTTLANRATNIELWRLVHGVAFSPSVAKAMSQVSFASIKVAAAPNRNSILEVLGHEQFSTF